MRSLVIGDMEVAEIHARADRRISRFVGKLFPDRRFVKIPLKVLRSHRGDVFETMEELSYWGYFRGLERDAELTEKCKIALEIVMHLMHYRSRSRIIASPNNCHMAYVRRLAGPWYKLELGSLREVRSQIIAMQSEGSPLD